MTGSDSNHLAPFRFGSAFSHHAIRITAIFDDYSVDLGPVGTVVLGSHAVRAARTSGAMTSTRVSRFNDGGRGAALRGWVTPLRLRIRVRFTIKIPPELWNPVGG